VVVVVVLMPPTMPHPIGQTSQINPKTAIERTAWHGRLAHVDRERGQKGDRHWPRKEKAQKGKRRDRSFADVFGRLTASPCRAQI
jgi:hypothetical protein